ncbi:hypothetical protein [Bradyrhizobium tunisiense]|uniref:hypothetical protein n=1 Tax=Bradyrhizobium tunisiense TaxID=3278709 RepID=UPI0035D9DB4C
MSKIKEMYEHPAVIVGRWFGVSDKTAKRKLNFERALTVEELGTLIRSERGFEVVCAVMGDAKPAWWRIMVPLMDIAEIQQMQNAAKRRARKTMESVLDADRDLSLAIQRAEALALHDPEHVSTQIDALRSMRGVPDRSMASSKRRP